MQKELKFVLLGLVIIIAFFAYRFMSLQSSISSELGSGSGSTNNPVVVLHTNYGEIELELFQQKAPKTVDNFLKLARSGFYDGTLFHRVIKTFMIQGGDPNTKSAPDNWALHGTGGPGYTFADEFVGNSEKLVRGILAMANAGPDTNGSQFFIITAPATDWLDGKHTPFGRVIAGMEVVDKIELVPVNENAHPLEDVKIEKVEVR